MQKQKLEDWVYDFKRMKSRHPEIKEVYAYYYDGDYYNRAYTELYDETGKCLEHKTHSYYG